MKYESKLERGTLIRRYKRFLADLELDSGEIITIHCPNTGSMKHCAEAGDEVWFSTSANEKRKYRHTWELTRTARGDYIGVNTSRANHLVKAAIEENAIAELLGYDEIRSEVKYGNENSRIDLFLSGHESAPDCFVEVKNVTLLEQPVSAGVGYFPDAVSTRGAKHLRELAAMVSEGHRAVLCFCVQHSGIKTVRPAAHIDSEYDSGIKTAVAEGVEVLAYKTRMTPNGSRIFRRIGFELSS